MHAVEVATSAQRHEVVGRVAAPVGPEDDMMGADLAAVARRARTPVPIASVHRLERPVLARLGRQSLAPGPERDGALGRALDPVAGST